MKSRLIFLVSLAFVGWSVSLNAQNIVDVGTCGNNGNNLTWVLTDDSVLTISGNGAMADFYWSNFAPWYSTYRLDFKTVIITEGVTSIGTYAFHQCSKVDSISIPSTVSLIGYEALYSCINLTAVTCFAKQPPSVMHDTAFFPSWNNCTLYVPFDTRDIYWNDTNSWGWGQWRRFTRIIEMFDPFATTNLNLIDIDFQTFSVQSGDTFSLVYTVRNYTEVNGEWTDVVYFSQDSLWSINAIEVMRVKKMRHVADTSTYKDTLVGIVPPMFDGAYYVIVRCNAAAPRVQETDYSDNVLTAQNKVTVSVESLILNGAAKNGTLVRGQQKLYKLTLANNQTVRILDTVGHVNMAIAYQQMPTVSTSRQGTNYISVSTAGDYYILLSNNDLDTLQVQTYVVSAIEVLGLEITKVFADTIVRYGSIFIPVEIIGCNAVPQIELVDANSTHFPADTIYSVSDILFVAQFNTNTMPAGDYSVYAFLGNESDIKVNALYLKNGNPYEALRARIVFPSSVRASSVVSAHIEYQNTGNVYIAAPYLFLTGKAGTTYQAGGVGTIYPNQIYLTTFNSMGLPYLRPGERKYINVHIRIPNQQGPANYMIYIMPDTALIDSVTINILASLDPNEKVGIKGAGDKDFVMPADLTLYDVYFENDPSATAPAQVVTITDTLDEAFDLTTFRFTAVQIGDLTIPVAELANETILTDLRPNNDLLLQTKLQMDINQRIVTVTFSSLDTATGEVTDDPLAGFLPPNDASHRGEGHFSYRVNLKNNVQDNYEVKNTAHIIFDANEPIATNTTSHFVDALPPISSVYDLPAAEVVDSAFILWGGTDASSGIKHYDIYVAQDRGAYTIWQRNTTENSSYFYGTKGHYYSFFSIATDLVGHVEEMKTAAEAGVRFIDGVGIVETHNYASVQVYPNPTNGQLKITGYELGDYRIYSVIGQVVMQGKLQNETANINITSLPNGLYFLKIDGKVVKIIKE